MTTSELELPDRLIPDFTPETVHVPVALTESRPMNPEHIQQLQHKLGLVKINAEQSIALKEMGIVAKDLGVVNVIRGTVLISQQTLMSAMVSLSNRIDEGVSTEETSQIAKALGYLAGQLAKVNMGSAKMENAAVQSAQAGELRKKMSFPMGRTPGPVIDVTPKSG